MTSFPRGQHRDWRRSCANILSAPDEPVVAGVPSKGFVIPAAKIREGAICINVSQHMNFGDGTDKRCALVPAVGKVTIAILARNLLRLFDNFHAKPTRRPSRATVSHVR